MPAKELKVYGETVLMPVSNIVNDDGTVWAPPTISTELVNLGTLSASGGTLTSDQVTQIGTTTLVVTARASVNSVTRFYERVNISGTTALLISADNDALHVLTVNLSTRAYTLSDVSLGGDFNPSGSYPNLTAGKAAKDGSGNDIAATYVKKTNLVDFVYPVGSVYINYADSSSPASTLGGSWTRIYNKFLIGAGSNYTIGTEGGEEFHQLTTAEIPSHTHNTNTRVRWASPPESNALNSSWASSTGNLVINSSDIYTSNTGGDTPHNNMPPYRAVWMWRRTA